VPAGACIAAPGYPRSAVAALEQYGLWRVEAGLGAASTCTVMLRQERRGQSPTAIPAGWELVAGIKRPTDRDETTQVLRRLR